MLPILPIRQLGARSSILLHSYPSFYACYLLKSIQTPQSTTVYIGSTPSPPRRIRQHNGEIAQGARKTHSKRPWVMQMIVHGFPSRLAALQFEWAWQHPHKSRHMRDSNGRIFGERRSYAMKKNIAIVRSMIARHPFNTWPLHVKLFTEEAVQHWNASERTPNVPPLPPGFTCAIELEGVDGKSGHPGSGRTGPMAADDTEFTAALLAKNTALIASGRSLECSVCHDPLHTYMSDPLSAALCPSIGCVATSHVSCLSEKFLKEEGSQGTTLIPRGGDCDSCGKYTLWGDIVRGCYRRLPPTEREGQGLADIASDDMFVTDEDLEAFDATPKKRKSPNTSSRASTRRASRKRHEKSKATDSSEGESFDFDNIASSSETDSGTPMKRKPGRPRKNAKSPTPNIASDTTPKLRKKQAAPSSLPKPKSKPTKAKGKAKAEIPSLLTVSSEGESFDFSNIVSSSDSEPTTPMKRTRGRPRKIVASSVKISTPKILRSPARKKIATSSSSKINTASPGKTRRKRDATAKGGSAAPTGSEGEIFDSASGSESDSATVPLKRKPGRPRKDALAASTHSPIISHTAHLSGSAHATPSLSRPFHSSPPTRPRDIEPISSDSSSDVEILHHVYDNTHKGHAGRTLNYNHTPKTSTPARGAFHPIRPPNSWLDEALDQAMSTLSIAMPSHNAVNGCNEKHKDIEVIVLSD